MNADEWSVMWARGYTDGFGDVLTTIREMAEKSLYTLAEIIEELKADRADLRPTDCEPQSLGDEWDHGYVEGFEAAFAHLTPVPRPKGTVRSVLASLEKLRDSLTVPEEEELSLSPADLDLVLADVDQRQQRVASRTKVRQHNQVGRP